MIMHINAKTIANINNGAQSIIIESIIDQALDLT
jgi:hypothetical protein